MFFFGYLVSAHETRTCLGHHRPARYLGLALRLPSLGGGRRNDVAFPAGLSLPHTARGRYGGAHMWEEEIRMSVFTSWEPHRNRRLDVDGSHSVARRIVRQQVV